MCAGAQGAADEPDRELLRLKLSPDDPAPPGMPLLAMFFSPPTTPAELTAADQAADVAVRATVSRCRIAALFDDSKFLGPEALTALVAAVAAASAGARRREGGDVEASEAGLELLVKLAIRNRDRITLLLPLVTKQVRSVVEGTDEASVALTQRAVCGLLRICRRLLPYRHDVEEQLVESLKVRAAPELRSFVRATTAPPAGAQTAAAEEQRGVVAATGGFQSDRRVWRQGRRTSVSTGGAHARPLAERAVLLPRSRTNRRSSHTLTL